MMHFDPFSPSETLAQSAASEAVGRYLRIPTTTYRLQLNANFPLVRAREVVDYLDRLGVTDCYCSPYLRARPGSLHGYDICDHNTLNPELGSVQEYDGFVEELRARGMGQVLDYVPNHMGIDPVMNHWWRDVLENGPCSPFSRFFDIDWEPVKPELHGKILLPVLGDQYGVVLERGELQLGFSNGSLFLRYWEHNFPINPRQAPRVYGAKLPELGAKLGEDHPHLREFLSILTALRNLPSTNEREPERIAERHREKEVARERLARLTLASPEIAEHIQACLKAFNGEAGQPRSFDPLHELLEAQAYRLSYWRTAFHEINFRRFFDINSLAGIRMEDPAVFAETHRFLLQAVGEGKVTGVRLDHLDGLFDPTEYLNRLQQAIWREVLHDGVDHSDLPPFYVTAEKILSAGEALSETWRIYGTTGYEFLNDLNRLFVSPRAHRHLRKVYERFAEISSPFEDVVYDCKKLIISTAMSSELNMLAMELNRISEAHRRTRDFTLDFLRDALRETVACFPVYRTYVNESGWTAYDARIIDVALRRARSRNPTMEVSIFAFIRDALLPRRGEGQDEHAWRMRLRFSMKFQQYTGPVQAKGLEDTAFYRDVTLLSVNEVGGDPARPGGDVRDFHETNRRRQESFPYAMLATATHDTKRGEDARMRLDALTEYVTDFRLGLYKWSRANAASRTVIDGRPAPDRNDEYLFYQTLLGVWPTDSPERPDPALVERVKAYMMKAIKEAKRHTSWISPNSAYETAASKFIDAALLGESAEAFLAQFLPFQRRIAHDGMVLSLAQIALKALSPGIPDFYQGTELWDLSLVDPDNRRPVDYDLRRSLLDGLEPLLEVAPPAEAASAEVVEHRRSALSEIFAQWTDGRIKLLITAALLRLRRRHPQLFLQGKYEALAIDSEFGDHFVAIGRKYGDLAVATLVPRAARRFFGAAGEYQPAIACGAARLVLPEDWAGLSFRDVLTGLRWKPRTDHTQEPFLPAAQLLQTLPVSLLVAETAY